MANGLPDNIQQAGQKAAELAGVAGDYKAGENSVIDVLRQKVTQAYADNRDIIENLDKAISDYFSSPSVAREKFQNIWNPFQRESLVSQYTANQAIPMMTNAGILGQRMGRIEDLVGAGVRGFQAQSAREQGRAQLAQQNYQDLLSQYRLEQEVEQANRPNQSIVEANGRRYLVTYDFNGNVLSKTDLGAASTGGGDSRSVSEKERDRQTVNLINDVKKGIDLRTAAFMYGGQLEPSDILKNYNDYSPYGHASESAEDLYKTFNFAAPKEQDSLDKLIEDALRNSVPQR